MLVPPGVLHVDGNLSAYGLSQGGSLSLTSNKIIIGAKPASGDQILNLAVTNGELDLAANSGFRNVNLVSNSENITVKADTNISLISENRLLTANYRNQASSNSIAGFSQVTTLPENLRKSVSLSLTGQTGVTLDTGSKIHVDKASTVNLTSENLGKGIYIDGLIDAQAGNINLILDVKAGDPALPYDGGQAIWLGSHAYLNTQGSTVLNPVDVLGRSNGNVLNGGNVTARADRGYVVVEKRAIINVSGTSASLDLPVANSGGLGVQTKSQVIGSDAGKISLTAAEGIVLDGIINAKAGSATNRGGSLDITLDRNQRKETLGDSSFKFDKALQFNVVQSSQVKLPTNAIFGSNLDSINSLAAVSSQQISQAGIDQLRLSVPLQKDPNNGGRPLLPGVIQFVGDVNLNSASSIVLDTQNIGWSGANGPLTGAVNFNTAYLQLGSSTYNAVIGTS
ncbi:MAG: hypothetical protein NTX38_14025, partial [Methylobacter sp.]|nr:hypothetical protein [Methylobacter sp.]